ncbi:hypothetical protein FPQ18DRAFT_303582 [Pyronema domesticum]|nr:hypothetical protein FPQ18DRAFT_303582 [Pyronema domesticum]
MSSRLMLDEFQIAGYTASTNLQGTWFFLLCAVIAQHGIWVVWFAVLTITEPSAPRIDTGKKLTKSLFIILRLAAISRSVLEDYSELSELSKSFAKNMKQEIDFLVRVGLRLFEALCSRVYAERVWESRSLRIGSSLGLQNFRFVFKSRKSICRGGCPYYYLPCWVFVVQENLASPLMPIGLYSSIPESSYEFLADRRDQAIAHIDAHDSGGRLCSNVMSDSERSPHDLRS